MSRYLDPKADIVFKKIFGEHPHLLMSFLNAVLPLAPDGLIVDLTYLPSEQIPSIPAFKTTVADVKCTDVNGRVFIVEMQMNWTDSFRQRLLFGTSQAIVKQLERGEDYQLLQPVYGLGLIAEIYDKATPEWYHHYQLIKKSADSHDVIDHLQLVFIELPKFPVHSSKEKKLRLLWLRFLREIDEKTKTVADDLMSVPEIREAVTLAEHASYSPGELDRYEAYWDSVSRDKMIISDSLAKGRAEGKAEGLAEGKAEGEANAKSDMVKNMLKQNMTLEMITAITGFSLVEIEKIKTQF